MAKSEPQWFPAFANLVVFCALVAGTTVLGLVSWAIFTKTPSSAFSTFAVGKDIAVRIGDIEVSRKEFDEAAADWAQFYAVTVEAALYQVVISHVDDYLFVHAAVQQGLEATEDEIETSSDNPKNIAIPNVEHPAGHSSSLREFLGLTLWMPTLGMPIFL